MSASPDLAPQMANGKITTHHAVCAYKSTLLEAFSSASTAGSNRVTRAILVEEAPSSSVLTRKNHDHC